MASSTGRSRWDDKGSASLGGGTTAVASGRHDDDEESASPVDAEKRKHDDGEGATDDAVKKPKVTMGFSRTFSSAKATEEKKPGPAPISIKFGGTVQCLVQSLNVKLVDYDV
ncbi:hypothetical protein MTO96_008473 [Rhipicephalus appendiculatus]